jgi:hypothetical protein
MLLDGGHGVPEEAMTAKTAQRGTNRVTPQTTTPRQGLVLASETDHVPA